MQKIFLWITAFTVLISLGLFFSACGSNQLSTAPAVTQSPSIPQTTPTEPATEATPTEPEPTWPPTCPVIDVLKDFYEPDGTVTPVDFYRMTYLPMEGLNDLITWTVDVSEDVVSVIPTENGTVIINVNELCETDTPYTLTASVVNADGIRVYHSWQYIIPKARDMAQILDEAYALPAQGKLSYYATLTGTVTSIDKAWSEDYQNITLIMKVESAGNRSVRCYRLTGEGAESLKIGDVITVTGILQKYGSIVEFDSGCKLQIPLSTPEEES